ncbi:MAG TPA: SRPBCC family protein [Kofleriaceae bacterium]|jgi:hypothetical protein|nr:SRPBCC family protein [Kofleriaceae bacterium]
MATLHKEIVIGAPRALVWDALRDIGALHTRLVPGFVVDTKLDGSDARMVTFGNGMVVREPILSIDNDRHRLAWCVEGGATTHYHAVIEVLDAPGGCRVVWTTDFLPHAAEAPIAGMQDQALSTMKRTLEAAAAR